jgi:hypothetical protein
MFDRDGWSEIRLVRGFASIAGSEARSGGGFAGLGQSAARSVGVGARPRESRPPVQRDEARSVGDDASSAGDTPHLERYEAGSVSDKARSERDRPAVQPDAAHSVLARLVPRETPANLERDGAHPFGIDGHAEGDTPRLQPPTKLGGSTCGAERPDGEAPKPPQITLETSLNHGHPAGTQAPSVILGFKHPSCGAGRVLGSSSGPRARRRPPSVPRAPSLPRVSQQVSPGGPFGT